MALNYITRPWETMEIEYLVVAYHMRFDIFFKNKSNILLFLLTFKRKFDGGISYEILTFLGKKLIFLESKKIETKLKLHMKGYHLVVNSSPKK